MKKGEYFEKNKPVDLYINKASSPQKEILEELRNLIFRTVPNSVEQFKWNQPVYLNEKD